MIYCYICDKEIERPEELTFMEDLSVHADCLQELRNKHRDEVTPEGQND